MTTATIDRNDARSRVAEPGRPVEPTAAGRKTIHEQIDDALTQGPDRELFTSRAPQLGGE